MKCIINAMQLSCQLAYILWLSSGQYSSIANAAANGQRRWRQLGSASWQLNICLWQYSAWRIFFSGSIQREINES
jgi:hypothetical protein